MKAATNIEVRLNNRRRLLKLLFKKGEMSKQDIAEQLNMSFSTVNYLVKDLMEKGLLTTGTLLDSTGGRKPTCIRPVYHAKFSIGVETASDTVRIVLVDLGAHITAKESYRLPQESSPSYWKKVGELIEDFGKKYNVPRSELLEVGITIGVTLQDERVTARKNKENEFVFDMQVARDNIGIPVRFRHATKMAAVAQCRQSESSNNFIYIYIGAKISGAMIVDGEVIDFSGINGEFGCMVTLKEKDDERVDSIFSRITLCEKGGCRNLEEFFERLKNNDSQCRTVFDSYLEELAKFVHNIYCIFGWNIVLGGSVSPYLVDYLPYLEEKIHNYYPFEEMPDKILSVSVLGEYGAAVGAALLAVNRFMDSDI